jgi:putative ATP-dependent endonuclease of OLD family
MFLSRLAIQNFRSIKSLDVSFAPGKNVIVGRNNSGKSNIIKAIDLMLGEYSPTYHKSENITANDYHNGDTSAPIFIWCELTRVKSGDVLEPLNDDELAKINYFRLYGGVDFNTPITINITDFDDRQIDSLFFNSTEDGQIRLDSRTVKKCWIGNKSYSARSTPFELKDIDKFGIAFRSKFNEGYSEKEMAFFYRKSSDAEWIEASTTNFRNALIQSAIIPSFRDPKDQLRITAYSWFGKLLRKYVDSDNLELAEAFNGVRLASDKLFASLKSEVSDQKISVAFPNTTISFQFNPDTKQDIHRSTLIYVDDGFNSELKDKGAGIQSAVMIALFDFYVRNIAHTASSLLAVEEPELYLHPHGRRVVADRFSSFLSSGNNQLILTTHSAEFISNLQDRSTVICVTKGAAGTEARNISFEDVKKRQILIKKQNAEMFFADAVILTEGADKYFVHESSRILSEYYVVESANGDRKPLSANWLNEFNVSILNCGGKSELVKYGQILTEAGIPFVATADFDFFRSQLVEYLSGMGFDKSYVDHLNALKSQVIASQEGKPLKDLGQIADGEFNRKVAEYLVALREDGIFIFSGELEKFYTVPPEFDKEAGVIETLSKCLETSKPINEFVHIGEYLDLLLYFAQDILKIKLVSKDTEKSLPSTDPADDEDEDYSESLPDWDDDEDDH